MSAAVPTFPLASDVAHYLQSYARDFGLYRHCRFNTKVESIAPLHEDRGSAVQWQVTYKSIKDATPQTQLFDRVIVTTGSFSKPRIPSFPLQEEFGGKIIHSQAYKE